MATNPTKSKNSPEFSSDNRLGKDHLKNQLCLQANNKEDDLYFGDNGNDSPSKAANLSHNDILEGTDGADGAEGTGAVTSNDNSSSATIFGILSANTSVGTDATTETNNKDDVEEQKEEEDDSWTLTDVLESVMESDKTGKLDNTIKVCELVVQCCVEPYNFQRDNFLTDLSQLYGKDKEIDDYFAWLFQSKYFTNGRNLTLEQMRVIVQIISETMNFYEKQVIPAVESIKKPKLTDQNIDGMKESLNEKMRGNIAGGITHTWVNLGTVILNVKKMKQILSPEDYNLYIMQLTKYKWVRQRVSNVNLLDFYEKVVNSIYEVLGCGYDANMRIGFESAQDCIDQSQEYFMDKYNDKYCNDSNNDIKSPK